MKRVTDRISVAEEILDNLSSYTEPMRKPKVLLTTRSVVTNLTKSVETTYRAAKLCAVSRCHDHRYRYCVFTIQPLDASAKGGNSVHAL